MISPQTIQRVTEAAQIEEVVRDFLPNLKRVGSALKACCPFHGEKTPSFTVTPSRGIYKCFGCGKGGDSVNFLIQSGKTFVEAIEYLAKKYNVEIEYTSKAKPEDIEAFDLRTRVRVTLSALNAVFSADENTPGRKYWTDRGYSPEILDAYGIGYCPDVSTPNISPEQLKEAGVANEKGNLSYYKRATLPIHDYRGNIVSMVGRSLDPAAKADKYLNGRTVPGVYEKGKFLYNLHRADTHIRATGEIWIVEGYADSMALTQLGKPNNVAVCGVSLTDDHLKALKRYNGDRPLRIYWGGDNQNTEAVTAAKWASVRALLTIAEVRVVQWPQGCKDAGEIISQGKRFDLVKTEDAIEAFVKEKWSKEFADTGSPVEKAMLQDQVADLISRVTKENARDIYINSICGMLQISPKKLEELVKGVRSKNEVEKGKKSREHIYIKVKDDYLERQVKPDNATGTHTVIYVPRKRPELVLEKGGTFVKEIPRFHNWITEPDHINYRREVIFFVQNEGEKFRFFNRYHPLPAEPKEFPLPDGFLKDPANFDYEQIPEIKYTAAFFKHIFDYENYRNRYLTIGWDWVSLCYLKPKQRLQALALVSTEEGTGKSTFINLCLKIFGQNATKSEAGRIGANFNAMMSGKVICCVEETKDEKGHIENKLKDLITGFEMVIERKHQDAEVEESFAKFVFASNHEDSFMKVGSATTRFFVMKVHPIKTRQKDYEEKMYREIPYLLYFMQKRGVLTPDTDRLWFDPKILENEALLKLRQSSKDIVQQNIEELLSLLWCRCELPAPYIRINSEYLKQMMVAYGGKMYEQKTPNYFSKVAVVDCKCVYKDKPTTFELPQMSGMMNYDWLTSDRWEYEMKRTKGRYIEFPVWKYCGPEEILNNFTPSRVDALVKAFETDAEYLSSTYGAEPAEWLESLKEKIQIVKIQPADVQEELPF